MNKKEREQRVRDNHNKYCVPGQPLDLVKKNVICISTANSKEHEHFKVDLAFESQFYITEAQRPAKSEEEKRLFKLKYNKIIDFVDLISGKETEIIHKHESDEQIEFYRRTGVLVFIVGDIINCTKCHKNYPRRNKGEICQICRIKPKRREIREGDTGFVYGFG
ncbi:hypothetical protein LCGC14_2386090 [marine sediment metagenome]|uniref:Uncharacterized protein n=1 Tax=marine sediment metagenome TaxID=412755 RepID=A0A0F9EBX7_9ZZZZ